MAVKRIKMGDKPFVQFSKRLITAVMILWGIMRIFSLIAVFINPDSGTTMAMIIRGVDDIAMVNVLAYTGNSVSEKIALGYFNMRISEVKEKEKEEENVNEEADGLG